MCGEGGDLAVVTQKQHDSGIRFCVQTGPEACWEALAKVWCQHALRAFL